MTSAVAAIIIALVSVSAPRAEQLAAYFTDAAQAESVDVAVLVALAYHESAFDHRAVSPAGAKGTLQLMPLWRSPRNEAGHVRAGARVLAYYKRRCRTMTSAITAYRTGRCGRGPRAVATMRLAAIVRARIADPSPGKLVTGRLP